MYVWQERRERQDSETNIIFMSNDRMIKTLFWAKTVLSKQNSNNRHIPRLTLGVKHFMLSPICAETIFWWVRTYMVPGGWSHKTVQANSLLRHTRVENLRISESLHSSWFRLKHPHCSWAQVWLFLSSSLTTKIMSDSEDFSEDEGGKQKFQPTLRYLSFDGEQKKFNWHFNSAMKTSP